MVASIMLLRWFIFLRCSDIFAMEACTTLAGAKSNGIDREHSFGARCPLKGNRGLVARVPEK